MIELKMQFNNGAFPNRRYFVEFMKDAISLLDSYFHVRVDSTADIKDFEIISNLPENSVYLGNGLWFYDEPTLKEKAFSKVNWGNVVQQMEIFSEKIYKTLPLKDVLEFVDDGSSLFCSNSERDDVTIFSRTVLDVDNFTDKNKQDYKIYKQFKSKIDDLCYQFIDC